MNTTTLKCLKYAIKAVFCFTQYLRRGNQFNGPVSRLTIERAGTLKAFFLKQVFLNHCTVSRLNFSRYRHFVFWKLNWIFVTAGKTFKKLKVLKFDFLNDFKNEKSVSKNWCQTSNRKILGNFDLYYEFGVSKQPSLIYFKILWESFVSDNYYKRNHTRQFTLHAVCSEFWRNLDHWK